MSEVHVLAIDLAKRSFHYAARIAAGRFCSTGRFRALNSSKCFLRSRPASSRWKLARPVTTGDGWRLIGIPTAAAAWQR